MNVALRRPVTLDQFLAWEERQELRYEFDGTEPRAMTGGTRAHAAIQANVITALRIRLRGQSCQAFGSELKILAAGSIRYPDALITCTPGQPDMSVATEPVVVFEVLSNSSAHIDLYVKNEEYRQTPSICRYVILEQTHAAALVFSRKGEDWVAETIKPGGVLLLPEAGIAVPFDEFYLDVVLAGSAEGDEPSPSVR